MKRGMRHRRIPPRQVLQRYPDSDALMKLPGFGSGAVCDSKGHGFLLGRDLAPGKSVGTKRRGGFRAEASPRECRIQKMEICYTYFCIHARLVIMSWIFFFKNRFSRTFLKEMHVLLHSKKNEMNYLSEKLFHHKILCALYFKSEWFHFKKMKSICKNILSNLTIFIFPDDCLLSRASCRMNTDFSVLNASARVKKEMSA
ncbi:hypothetical protein SAMN04488082_10442 [Desulfomicrobium apsheronum]|uniref:Uncharacterized protein n=2 Tax=Desulfomicrobium apsheronum TaxID=52560 RepID=A0A1I3S8F9_9BACT|nr:hypothetical protein SAMN04488082_10442 [Desulfomicrobium apsheronum]